MNYLKKIFIILLLLTNTIQPFVSYYLFKKDNNYIFMLGDIHSTSITEINFYHTQVFIEFISKYRVQIPIPFILECGFNLNNIVLSKSISDKINNNHARDITMRSLNAYFSKDKKVFDLISYDCRESKTFILYLILEELDIFIAYNKPSNQFNFEAFKAKITFSTNITLVDYLNSLENNKIYIKNWLSQFNSESSIFKEMNYLYKKHTDRIEYIFELLANENTNSKFDTFLINTFENCKTIEDVQTKRSEIIFSMFYADVRFADIGFLQKIVEAQSKHPKALFVTGKSHTISISDSLQRIGYKLIISKNANPQKEFINNICETLHSFLSA